MRRSVAAIVTALLVGGAPLGAPAGWRSADRPDPESPPESMTAEPPCDHDCPDQPDDEWRQDRLWRNGHPAREDTRFGDTIQEPTTRQPATQPYWGTMHPYWNAPEPPGVIHRGARTQGFKKTK